MDPTTYFWLTMIVFAAAAYAMLCLHQRVNRTHERVNDVNRTVSAQAQNISMLSQGIGHLWRTAAGEVLRIRDMSTGHLRNCINGGFAKGAIAHAMSREIARRTEDATWRARDAEDPTVAESSRADDLLRQGLDPDEDYVFLAESEGSGLVFDVFSSRELAERFVSRRHGLRVRPMVVQTDEED